ncbi:peptidase M23 [Polaribacter aestuariivivens]|uniref:Peptidase M23 n=1 Tax=Polaribacter aestuariivivens TaxID=2304626 RepID=A0A5S3NAK0_9FLAO|nr:peptidoglycan DD-metalloendopeptidase family protein [Polaribacter aestuariivivens]TMM32290.1 peptidase M23 [Polaribacter aestuariivivens]
MNKTQGFIEFKNWTENQNFSLQELFPTIKKNEIFNIDLSTKNTLVKTESEFNNPEYFSEKLEEIQLKNPTKIIAGGYLEKRALYTSDIYNATDKNSHEKRNIHLGVDFWLPSETPVHAICDGEVVSATHQKPYKGYGGFIILKHTFNEVIFYTLYGHLSKKSTLKFSVGDIIKKDAKIGVLGNYAENGEWVPHLHFQIMLSLLNYDNDFPGVALESELAFWKTVCPNPNMLLKMNS